MIELVAVDPGVDQRRLQTLAGDLTRILQVHAQVREGMLDISCARNEQRMQYHSTTILSRLDSVAPGNGSRLVGIAAVDLFVPIFTFVFGEAQIGGRCAVASFYRLQEQLYGLPPDEERLRERLTKETVHELGHTFGLPHCDQWDCVMHSSHSVELVDVKSAAFCPVCGRTVQEALKGEHVLQNG